MLLEMEDYNNDETTYKVSEKDMTMEMLAVRVGEIEHKMDPKFSFLSSDEAPLSSFLHHKYRSILSDRELSNVTMLSTVEMDYKYRETLCDGDNKTRFKEFGGCSNTAALAFSYIFNSHKIMKPISTTHGFLYHPEGKELLNWEGNKLLDQEGNCVQTEEKVIQKTMKKFVHHVDDDYPNMKSSIWKQIEYNCGEKKVSGYNHSAVICITGDALLTVIDWGVTQFDDLSGFVFICNP
jgi:hypothetical protein